eukprot:COSAG04_NODE_13855_length_589_cov_4.808163_1_plen_72_part_01
MGCRCRCLGSDCVSSTPSLTGDIGALAGLSLTSLWAPTPAPLLALSPLPSSASFADGASGAYACSNVYGTAV